MKRSLSAVTFFILSNWAATEVQAQISFSDFQLLQVAFHQEFDLELQQQNAVLLINNPPTPATPNFWWDLETVRASYSSDIDESGRRLHYLFVLGGFARLPMMSFDEVAATLCHELGHGLAGAPFKLRNEKELVSVEGQADYYAYRVCLERIFKRLPQAVPLAPVSALTNQLCLEKYSAPSDLAFCTRAFHVLEVERRYLKWNSETQVETSYLTPDLNRVDQVETSETYYPPEQCRLDTMVAGVLKKPRPACWFKD